MANPLTTYFGRAKFKQTWGGSWQTLAGVYPVRCLRGCAPVEQHADFAFDFGEIKREDATTFSIETPKDLRDWYAKIELYSKDDSSVSVGHWWGIIPRSTILRQGGVTSVDTGHQSFQAVGLEHLLDREMVSKAAAIQDGSVVVVQHTPAFNVKYKKGHKVRGNRSKQPGPDGAYVFSMAADAEVWNNRQIVEYLLAYFTPEGPEWKLSGQMAALEQIEEIYAAQGQLRTLWEWLNILIDRRRGLGFVVEPDSTEYRVNIRVFTLTDVAISVGNRQIPANDNQLTFTMPNTFPEWHLVDPIEFTKTTANVYDGIEVLGERMLACTTVSVADGRIKLASTKDERDAYIAASETQRTADRYDGVWSRFVFDPNWTYNVSQILGQSANDSLLLQCDDDGKVTAGGGEAWHDATTLARSLPFKRNMNYQVKPPKELFDEDERPEFLPPQVYAKMSEGSGAGGQWRHVDKMGEGDTGLPNCHIRVLDTRAGFQIYCSPHHLFAAEDWPKEANGAYKNVDQPPELKYQDIAATVAFRSDQRLRVYAKISQSLAHESTRVLVIECPGAEYWYATAATVVDAEGGSLKRIHQDNRVLRDDADILKGILAFAKAWYQKERQSVRIPIKEVANHVALGALLTSIGGQYQEQVNTVVSSMETDFRTNTMEYQTGWGEFDLIGGMLDERRGLASRRANEIEYLNE